LIVRSQLKSLRLNEQGTTAVEFAIVAPVFIALLVGTLALCVALFLIGSLHYAVEEGARCASVKADCQVAGNPDKAATQTYAQKNYFGPSVSPNPFIYAADTDNNCNRVTASISYSMNVGFKTFVIPIKATACFP
jgi:Flp pilus assembly protein TadG